MFVLKFLLANPRIRIMLILIGVAFLFIIVFGIITGLRKPETPASQPEITVGEDADETPTNLLEDGDNDGLTNQQENSFGTDETVADTDGDGISDGDEVTQGTDPLKSGGAPLTENENFASNLTLQFYDWRKKHQSTDSLSIQKEETDQFLKEKGLDVVQEKTLTPTQAGITVINRTPQRTELEQHLEQRYVNADKIPVELATFLLEANAALTETTVDELPTRILDLEQGLSVTISDLALALDETQNELAKIKSYTAEWGQDVADDIAAMQQLRDLLRELQQSLYTDPVLTARNILWAKQLLDSSDIYDYIYLPVIEIETQDAATFEGSDTLSELPEEAPVE